MSVECLDYDTATLFPNDSEHAGSGSGRLLVEIALLAPEIAGRAAEIEAARRIHST
jgi:hypothetical protein